jgi:hypothetical protein
MLLDMGLQEFLDKLPPTPAAPPYQVLAELSGISDEDAGKLAAIWAGWQPAVLRQFLRRLVSLAEENVLYEFDAVFKAALALPDAHARAISVGGLHESTDKSVARRLARLLIEDSAEEVRVAAAMGLIRYAAMACEGRMVQRDYERIRDALKAAIEKPDESREVRRRAIEAIGNYPADVNQGYIVRAYQSGDRLLQQSALYAMGRSGSRRWVPEITTSLSSGNAAIRYEAATALGMIGEGDDAPMLVGLLEDDDLQVRASALIALGRIGGASARRIIQREVRSGIPEIAEAARAAMEELDLGEPVVADEPEALGIRPEVNPDGNGHAR